MKNQSPTHSSLRSSHGPNDGSSLSASVTPPDNRDSKNSKDLPGGHPSMANPPMTNLSSPVVRSVRDGANKPRRYANPYERLEKVVPYILLYQYLKKVRTATEIDLIKYQDLLKGTTTERLFDLIVLKIEPYVRSYPQIAFRKGDEDIRSAFFVYIYERLDGIFLKFDHRLGIFSTYLSLKLKNYFLNYIRREKTMNKIRTVNYEIDSNTEAIFRDHKNLEMSVADKEFIAKERNQEEDLFSSLQGDPFRYLCVKLYFFALFTKADFATLTDFLKLNEDGIRETQKEIVQLGEELHRKKLAKIYYENCLNRTFYQNMMREEAIENLRERQQPHSEIEEVITKQKQINERRNSLLLKYHSVNVFPSMKQIARVLQSEPAKVSNIINYYKQQLMRNKSA